MSTSAGNRGAKRLLGFDRSGPPPAETERGQPWRPWTLPNLIGYIRIALIPLFLALIFSSEHGHDVVAAVVYAVAAWGDYFDGLLARITGQYSRLGALMDPFIDRLLVISAVIACWHFDLLPRWALLILLIREVLMLILARIALAKKIELRINWFGRSAVGPLLAAPFFAMIGAGTLAEVLLYIGLVLALTALVVYVRDGLREVRAQTPSS